jgi:hypothetical protein
VIWTIAMYERLLRLDGKQFVDVHALDQAEALDALSAAFPDAEAAEAALTALEAIRRPWTPSEVTRLRELYPETPTWRVAAMLGRSICAVYGMVDKLGLKKTPLYLAGPHACRLRREGDVGAATRFPKGHRPFNAGVKGWDAGGRSHETRFRPGVRGTKFVPIGTERLSKDGIRQRKVSETGYPPADWKSVHVLLWEEHNGPVPEGCVVVFRNRNRADVRIDNLELVTRAELMARNTIHRYPPELKQAIKLVGKLRRTIADHQENAP